MADTKRRAEEQLAEIHNILNQNEPDDVLIASIREVLYGSAPLDLDDEEEIEDEDDKNED